MRFMMLVTLPAGHPSERGETPSAELVGKMMVYNEELTKAGALITLNGLHPTSKGARVSFSGGKPSVTDGPFTESKELIGGYWIISADSLEAAIDWAKKAPGEVGQIEVRQVFEVEDFPQDVQEVFNCSEVKEAIAP